MTAPVSYKSVKVSPQTHHQLHDLAQRMGGSADEALAYLLDPSTVRVPVSPIQRQRWNEADQDAGVTLSEFIRLRIEAALQFGTDPTAIAVVYSGVRALCTAAGLSVEAPSTTGTPPVDR